MKSHTMHQQNVQPSPENNSFFFPAEFLDGSPSRITISSLSSPQTPESAVAAANAAVSSASLITNFGSTNISHSANDRNSSNPIGFDFSASNDDEPILLPSSKSSDGEQKKFCSKNWKAVSVEDSLVKDLTEIKTFLKSREFSATEEVADRLYSSIKYELQHTIEGKAFRINENPLFKQAKFLLTKIQVVDAETLQEIRKSNNKCILNGNCEASMLPKNNGSICSIDENSFFECSMKIQFNDVSYHHSRRQFAFKVSFYLNNLLEKPFLEKVSAPFLVLARKPNGTTHTGEKVAKKKSNPNRKRNHEETAKKDADSKEKKSKKARAETEKGQELDFDAKLTDLISTLKELDQESRSEAVNKIFKELYQFVGYGNLFNSMAMVPTPFMPGTTADAFLSQVSVDPFSFYPQ